MRVRWVAPGLSTALKSTIGLASLLACGADDAASAALGPPPYMGPGALGAAGAAPAPGEKDPNAPAGGAPASGEVPQVGGLAPATDAEQPPQQPSGMQLPAERPSEPPPAMPPPASGTPPAGGSAGCGLSEGIPAEQDVPNTLLTFPPAYDGSTPVPLLFAFHGAGRTNTDMRTIDSRTVGSPLEDNYVVAFMKSAGNGWDLGTDYPRFQAALAQILAERCIDMSALFAMGHSSGAQFIAQMLGDSRARETRFAAVVPVASSLFDNPSWDPVPTLSIHGQRDTLRPNDLDGALDITQYARSNQCQMVTRPVTVASCASLADGVAVDPGCVQYDGCAAPTLFCRHDDPNYLDNGNPTNHGWPCFANDQIFDFLESNR